jgi:hypothetical protein
MMTAAEEAPDLFQERMEDLHRFVLKGQLEQKEREIVDKIIKDQWGL